MYYSQIDPGQIARAIAVKNGIRAIPTEKEWSYNSKTKELKYAVYKESMCMPYEQWYALLIHEISHAIFTDPDYLTYFPKDKQSTPWHRLHNAFEDNFIERQLELKYPQGFMYKKILKQLGADMIMNNFYSMKAGIGEVELYEQYLSLMLVAEAGIEGDVGVLYPIVDKKVQKVYDATHKFFGKEDFASTKEVIEYMFKNFDSYKTLIPDNYNKKNESDTLAGDVISGLFGDDTEEKVELITGGRDVDDDDEEYTPRPDYPKYLQLQKEVKRKSKELRQKIEPVLREVRARRKENRQKSGMTDPKRLWQAAIPKNKVFRRNKESEAKHYAVTILLDESGSMSGSPFRIALEATVMTIEACEEMKVPTRVARFSDTHWSCSKTWEVKHGQDEKGLVAASLYGGGTNDVPALHKYVKEASNDSQQTDRKHILFAITDGVGDEAMSNQAAKLQKQYGVEVYGIIVNSAGRKQQYPHAEFVESMEDLPSVMQRLLKKFIGRRI